jgi:hypothetical protein
VELLAKAQSSHPELQRYKILFICGNYSRIPSRLDRNFTQLEVRTREVAMDKHRRASESDGVFFNRQRDL